jgi:hypothetical protein
MSLGMTVGAREAALDSTDEEIEAQAAPPTPLWLIDLIGVAVTTVGVLVCSALGVVLFLR